MNKLFLTTAAVLFSTSLFAQQPVQVKGTLIKEFVKPVKLFKVVNGNMEEIASSFPQADKRFGFIFYPEYEGFYALGTGDKTSQTDNMVFYFKSGDILDLEISDFSYDLIGKKNSKENQVLHRWHKEINAVEDKAFSWGNTLSTFVDFFPELERTYDMSKSFLQHNKSGNKSFDSMLPTFIKWDLAANATNYLNTPRTVHPQVEDYPKYYHTLSIGDFSKEASTVYSLPWGNRTLAAVSFVTGRISGTPFEKGLNGLSNELQRLQNDTLKADAVLNYLSRQKSYPEYKEGADKYKTLFITPVQKQRAADIMSSMAQLSPGDHGLSFEFPDHEGRLIKFEDMKGKVVLIDVWATWCGPCKAEIPSLKKLEEDFKGTDLQVVSISLDEEEDKDKWPQMIKEENLGGIQLFASGWGDFVNYYRIKGIPRFMVFDREGKIVTIDAPRPSDSRLKHLLEQVLSR